MNTQVACLNLVLATAVFQTEYIIHDALLAVGHKPDETDGLILRIGAQMMKPSNPSRSHLETIPIPLQYASATAKASSAASRRFIFALKLSSTPSPPLQRLMESVYPSMSVPSLHEPLPVTLMQPETVGEQGFPFFRRDCLSHCQAYFPPSAPFWLTNNKYSRPSNHKHSKP